MEPVGLCHGARIRSRVHVPRLDRVEPVDTEKSANLVQRIFWRGLQLFTPARASGPWESVPSIDPDVRGDLERFFARLVPDGDSLFRHCDEGSDDMPAHVRAALMAV